MVHFLQVIIPRLNFPKGVEAFMHEYPKPQPFRNANRKLISSAVVRNIIGLPSLESKYYKFSQNISFFQQVVIECQSTKHANQYRATKMGMNPLLNESI